MQTGMTKGVNENESDECTRFEQNSYRQLIKE